MMPPDNPVTRLRAALDRANVPSTVHLDITYRCDLDCEHCYLDQKDSWPELVTADWLKLLAELQTAGVPYLIWSGGEVFARPDFMEMLEFANRCGFVSVIKTHAGNIDAALARSLAAFSVVRFDVSVYSLDDEIHDAVTRVTGSLAATLAGINALRAAGLNVRVTTVAMNSNVDELRDLKTYFESIGCEHSGSLHVLPDHSGSDQLDDLILSDDAYIRGKTAVLSDESRGCGVKPRITQNGAPCSAGRSLAYIAPDGAIWPCVMFPMSLGHLRDGDFLQVWQGSKERVTLSEWGNKDRTACQSCAGSGHCFYCPGEAYKRTGDFRQAPREFHQRARLAMIAYEPHADVTYSDEEWDSVPQSATPAPRGKFVFPIYQPTKKRRSSPQSVGS